MVRSRRAGVDYPRGSDRPRTRHRQDVVIVLYAERANVTTEVVPIEQVTVHTDVLTEQQSLWGTVSHEEITINDDTQTTHQQ